MTDKKKLILKETKEWAIAFLIAYVIYIIVNFFLGTVSGIKQDSMYPTAKEGEKVLIQRPVIFKKDLEYGMIVTCEAPLEYSKQDEDGIANYEEKSGLSAFTYDVLGFGKKTYIKRVIGVAGDELVIAKTGEVTKNGEKLDEIYLNPHKGELEGNYMKIKVPEGSVFLMGDNRARSKDSREFGCIPVEKITGYVITRVWPLNNLGAIE